MSCSRNLCISVGSIVRHCVDRTKQSINLTHWIATSHYYNLFLPIEYECKGRIRQVFSKYFSKSISNRYILVGNVQVVPEQSFQLLTVIRVSSGHVEFLLHYPVKIHAHCQVCIVTAALPLS